MAFSNLLIVVPMKDPAASKTRLKPVMSDTERQDLARGLFERTLDTIAMARCNTSVLVVTESEAIVSLCEKRGVQVLREMQSDGLNAAAARAADWAKLHGIDKLAILPADLALLSAADIEQLAARKLLPGHVLLCEATDGGTNCLMLSPPDAISFQFGPESFRAHRRSAMAQGLVCHVLRDSDMRFDVDTSQDLQWVQNQDWQRS